MTKIHTECKAKDRIEEIVCGFFFSLKEKDRKSVYIREMWVSSIERRGISRNNIWMTISWQQTMFDFFYSILEKSIEFDDSSIFLKKK